MSGSVSMVDGHIDPDKGRMTAQQAIKYFEDEILMLENAPNLNGCEMTNEWREQIEICKMAKSAIEKQIPKKPTKEERVPNGWLTYGYCPNCEHFTENTLKYCGKCGQALDWSDT